MSINTWLRLVAYRLRQVYQQLGFAAPLTREDYAEVEQWLPASAIPLFYSMSTADQRHCLRVCRGLQARGCMDQDILAAALLHDVGKAQSRVPFWTRPVIVIGKVLAPAMLIKLAVEPQSCDMQKLPRWRRELSYAWWHAELGAELAAAAGLSERAVLYIRTHHEATGPAAELHSVDKVS
jgi:hypothetical protein